MDAEEFYANYFSPDPKRRTDEEVARKRALGRVGHAKVCWPYFEENRARIVEYMSKYGVSLDAAYRYAVFFKHEEGH